MAAFLIERGLLQGRLAGQGVNSCALPVGWGVVCTNVFSAAWQATA